MLRTVIARGEHFALATPFRTSRGTKTMADVVTVEIGAGGYVGRGEGVPYPHYGESLPAALAAIDQVRPALEAGIGRDEVQAVMPAGAARNAVDCALWDLEAKCTGRSVVAMLGQAPIAPTVTAMTVGLDTPTVMAQAARHLAAVPLIKVKVDRGDPAAQIRAVRAAAPRPRMIVDPNESWTMAEVEGLQDLLLHLSVDLLEQPLPANDDAALEGFRPLVPIAADESLHVADDVARLAARYQVANIKLDKTGGLTAALALAGAAEAAGLQLMIGSMISTSLSIAPALVVAQRCRFVDLDGPLWLAHDRAGGVRGAGGVLSPPSPGFWG